MFYLYDLGEVEGVHQFGLSVSADVHSEGRIADIPVDADSAMDAASIHIDTVTRPVGEYYLSWIE